MLAITTPWPEFKNLAPEDFKRNAKLPVVLDCWRVLPRERFEGRVDYLMLGFGTSDGAPDREQVLAAEGD